jgi:hypothetical protein
MTWWQRFVVDRRLRRWLKRKAATPRAIARSSGLLEWSDREIARLQPSWVRRFITRQRRLARFLETLSLATLLAATLCFALSVEWFWVWEATVRATSYTEKQTVTKWQAWHAVKTRPPRVPPKAASPPKPPGRTARVRPR